MASLFGLSPEEEEFAAADAILSEANILRFPEDPPNVDTIRSLVWDEEGNQSSPRSVTFFQGSELYVVERVSLSDNLEPFVLQSFGPTQLNCKTTGSGRKFWEVVPRSYCLLIDLIAFLEVACW